MKNGRSMAWLLLLGFFGFIILGAINNNFMLASLGFIFLILLFTISSNDRKKREDTTEIQIKKALTEHDFIPDKSTISFDQNKVILISESHEKIALLTRESVEDNFNYKEFDFKDIIEAKVIKNNDIVTSTSLGSQVSRGLVGGVLLGGLGAIAGSMSAKTNSTNKVKELTLEIIVNDLLNPRYTFSFYKSDVGLESNKDKLKEIIDHIEDWYRTFTVVVERNKKLGSV